MKMSIKIEWIFGKLYKSTELEPEQFLIIKILFVFFGLYIQLHPTKVWKVVYHMGLASVSPYKIQEESY